MKVNTANGDIGENPSILTDNLAEYDKIDEVVKYLSRPTNRAQNACEFCKSRKMKCDEKAPSCSNCTKYARKCLYKSSRRVNPHERTLSFILQKLSKIESMLNAQQNDYAGVKSSPSDVSMLSHGSPATGAEDIALIKWGRQTSSKDILAVKAIDMPPSGLYDYNPFLPLKWKNSGFYLSDNLVYEWEKTRPPLKPTTMSVDISDVDIDDKINLFLLKLFNSYPILCDKAINHCLEEMRREGFGLGIISAVLLLIVACSSLLENGPIDTDNPPGFAFFSQAVLILMNNSSTFGVEYVQGMLLATIYLRLIGRPLDELKYLQIVSNLFVTMLSFEDLESIPSFRKHTIYRIYWVIRKMEAELFINFDLYPGKGVSAVDSRMELPLDCDSEASEFLATTWVSFLSSVSLDLIKGRAIESLRFINQKDLFTLEDMTLLDKVTNEISHQIYVWKNNLPPINRWDNEDSEPNKSIKDLQFDYKFTCFLLWQPYFKVFCETDNPALMSSNLQYTRCISIATEIIQDIVGSSIDIPDVYKLHLLFGMIIILDIATRKGIPVDETVKKTGLQYLKSLHINSPLIQNDILICEEFMKSTDKLSNRS